MKPFCILNSFTLALITAVLLASLFPARGDLVSFFGNLTTIVIILLFSMHGTKLSRETTTAGGGHWQLHLWIMYSTFALFPILGVLFAWWKSVNVGPIPYSDFLYLCILPAIVQPAVALTSMAGGNVVAAVCPASASSLLGVFLSPLLVGLVMNAHGTRSSLKQVSKTILQLLLPFVSGHLSRPWIDDRASCNKKWIVKTNWTFILLVVYTAFSEAVVSGIWHKVGWGSSLFIVVVSCVPLAIVIVVSVFMACRLGFNKADETTIVFYGSKESLINGIPMANILFPALVIDMMVLSLMIFHQIQLMVCAMLTCRYKRQIKQLQVQQESSADKA